MRLVLTALIALGLAACGRHDDGMGDLWKGLACVERGEC